MHHSIRQLALFTLLILLASCSPAPPPPPTALPTAQATPTVRPTALPTPRPTAPPAITIVAEPTARPGALTLWAAAEEPRLEALRKLITDTSRPLGVEVQVVGKSPDGLHADLRAAVLAGLPLPDLIWGTQDDLGIVQRQGLLQPAGDRLDAEAFLPATIIGATLDGERWGTPLAAQGALFLLYNKKLADRAPRTSDELIVVARQQTVGDRYGLVAGWAEPRWLAAWLAGFGGHTLTANGEPSLDTPQMVAALNLLKELRVAGPPPPSTYAEGARLFRQGRAAFALDGDWSLETYRQYTDTLDLGIAPLPLVPATGQAAAPPLGGIYLLYGKTLAGSQLAQARALGAALARREAQARVAGELGLLPALRAALDDPAVQSDPALATAALHAADAGGLPPTEALRCAWVAIAGRLPLVLLGELAPEEAGGLMQSSAANCLVTP
ncbi:MAG TPA: extracellular solute-binding protein [Roseiflexaceae bacterium]|nr:extracellular solute-binding protein [Roseiflexaceae bacterium]